MAMLASPTMEQGAEAIHAALRAEIRREGSLRKAAKRLKVSPAYLSDILLGRRFPGPAILRPLGFTVERRRVYRRESK